MLGFCIIQKNLFLTNMFIAMYTSKLHVTQISIHHERSSFQMQAGKKFYMANRARGLGLCAPIPVIQGRCQVVLGKRKKKRECKWKKIQSAVCSYLHSLLPLLIKNINQCRWYIARTKQYVLWVPRVQCFEWNQTRSQCGYGAVIAQ